MTNEELYQLRQQGMQYREIAEVAGLTSDAVRGRIRNYRPGPPPSPQPRLSASPFPKYDSPLTVGGDALVLNDLEVPFHHADFVNRCLDLAECWGVDTLILGGDVMHFESLSAWGAAWQEERPQIDTISEETEKDWRAQIEKLPAEYQGEWLERLTKLTANRDCQDDEIKAGAKTLQTLAQVFKRIYYILGNHDDRFLRKLQSPTTPQKLLNFLGLTEPCWQIRPYFYAVLESEGEKYRVEHQKSAAPNAAIRLADKFECHIIIAHNHLQSFQYSTSGRYYAVSSGCAVDEERLNYAATRSSQRPMHSLGAVMVRGGYPWVLSKRTPWKVLEGK